MSSYVFVNRGSATYMSPRPRWKLVVEVVEPRVDLHPGGLGGVHRLGRGRRQPGLQRGDERAFTASPSALIRSQSALV